MFPKSRMDFHSQNWIGHDMKFSPLHYILAAGALQHRGMRYICILTYISLVSFDILMRFVDKNKTFYFFTGLLAFKR